MTTNDTSTLPRSGLDDAVGFARETGSRYSTIRVIGFDDLTPKGARTLALHLLVAAERLEGQEQ